MIPKRIGRRRANDQRSQSHTDFNVRWFVRIIAIVAIVVVVVAIVIVAVVIVAIVLVRSAAGIGNHGPPRWRWWTDAHIPNQNKQQQQRRVGFKR